MSSPIPPPSTPPPWPHQTDGDCSIREFVFASGESIPDVRIRFTTIGQPVRNANGEIVNAALLLHATGGNRSNWLRPSLADALFAPGKPLDAARYFTILPDAIGHGRSSRPSEGLRTAFPRYGCRDQVRAQHILVTRALGIARLRVIAGISLGGMLAWLWGTMYPDMMDGLVPIGAEPYPLSGRNWIIRRIMIDSIRNDARWNGGDYAANPTALIATAPLLFLMAQSVGHLQALAPTREDADTYYRHLMTDVFGHVDANDLLYGIECGLDYDPSAGLDRIKAKVLSVNFAGDEIVPAAVNRTAAAVARLPGGRSLWVPFTQQTEGHLAYFLGDTWGPALHDLMRTLEQERPVGQMPG